MHLYSYLFALQCVAIGNDGITRDLHCIAMDILHIFSLLQLVLNSNRSGSIGANHDFTLLHQPHPQLSYG